MGLLSLSLSLSLYLYLCVSLSLYYSWMLLAHCQDHILTENIWFVWSRTSYSGDKWITDKQTREDSATQPMDAGWLSFAIIFLKYHLLKYHQFSCADRWLTREDAMKWFQSPDQVWWYDLSQIILLFLLLRVLMTIRVFAAVVWCLTNCVSKLPKKQPGGQGTTSRP